MWLMPSILCLQPNRGDDDGVNMQRIEEQMPQLQLTEDQLNHLLQLNDLYNEGVLDGDEPISLTPGHMPTLNPEIPVNGNRLNPQPGSLFEDNTSNQSISNAHLNLAGGLDYSDFGRDATAGLLTEHSDYALSDQAHSLTYNPNEPRDDRK